MSDTIQLRRQGVSHTLNGRFGRAHVELARWQNTDGYLLTITHADDNGRCHVITSKRYSDLETAKAEALRCLRGHPDNEVKFSDFIEAYMYYSDATLRIWPHVAADKYLACASYNEHSDSIRLEPENYCLIAFRDDGPVFDMDAAAKPYRDIVARAYREYEKPHNQRKSDRENKAWLAWLISEYVRKEFPERTPVVRDSIAA